MKCFFSSGQTHKKINEHSIRIVVDEFLAGEKTLTLDARIN
jgi:hypothetical protein